MYMDVHLPPTPNKNRDHIKYVRVHSLPFNVVKYKIRFEGAGLEKGPQI